MKLLRRRLGSENRSRLSHRQAATSSGARCVLKRTTNLVGQERQYLQVGLSNATRVKFLINFESQALDVIEFRVPSARLVLAQSGRREPNLGRVGVQSGEQAIRCEASEVIRRAQTRIFRLRSARVQHLDQGAIAPPPGRDRPCCRSSATLAEGFEQRRRSRLGAHKDGRPGSAGGPRYRTADPDLAGCQR